MKPGLHSIGSKVRDKCVLAAAAPRLGSLRALRRPGVFDARHRLGSQQLVGGASGHAGSLRLGYLQRLGTGADRHSLERGPI